MLIPMIKAKDFDKGPKKVIFNSLTTGGAMSLS